MIAWHLSDGSSIDDDPSTVRVLLDDARGSVSGQDLPLGWINFNASGRSEGIVHLSHRNVVQLLDATEAYRSRPIGYKELLAARALGRALAHELGHHLTASIVHSPSGLMKARRRVDELFSPARTGFTLNSDERHLVAKTLTDRASDITVEPCEELTAPSVSCPAAWPRRWRARLARPVEGNRCSRRRTRGEPPDDGSTAYRGRRESGARRSR
jgi:hypothetical protein